MGFNLNPRLLRAASPLIAFALLKLLAASAFAQTADSGAADTGSVFSIVNEPDSVAMSGLVIDRESGVFPAQLHATVFIDSLSLTPDSTGLFNGRVMRRHYHTVKITARGYAPFAATVQTEASKNNYFVTCALEKAAAGVPQALEEPAIGPGWTITGCIADSRIDLAIKSDSARLQFTSPGITLRGIR